jgi:hypothetical protein
MITAADITKAFRTAVGNKIDAERNMPGTTSQRAITVASSAVAWIVGPRVVAASVSSTDDNMALFGHMASDLLDVAVDMADPAGETFGTGEIIEVTRGRYLFSW